MSTIQKFKADTTSRLQEQKKVDERKRNILVLIYRHLISCGYTESASNLTRECNIDLEKWEVADNIDFYQIVQEFEDFHEKKFLKKPTIVRKSAEPTQSDIRIKRGLPPKTTGTSRTSATDSSTQASSSRKVGAIGRQNSHQNMGKYKQIADRQEPENAFEVQGKKVEAEEKKVNQQEQNQEFFENRILKPLPDYSYNPELKDLAMSIRNEIINVNPGVSFQNIIGLSEAKRLLKEAVLMPLKYPHFFEGILEPWKGVLLFGPPGTGKTMLAKAVATECRTTFFNISASTIVSKWRGDSEKLVRVLFDLARYYQPSTIFMDEIDSILSSRTGSGEHEASRRMKTELLIQLDGLIKETGDRVFLLAASNLPWDLDKALLRRLDKRILVPLPSIEARESMIRHHLPPGPAGSGKRADESIDFEKFAGALEGYSGSDIKLVCKEAAMRPLRRVMSQIEVLEEEGQEVNWHKQADPSTVPPLGQVMSEDVEAAISSTKAAAQMVKTGTYEKWMENYGAQ